MSLRGGKSKGEMLGPQPEVKQVLRTQVVRARAEPSPACGLRGLRRVTAQDCEHPSQKHETEASLPETEALRICRIPRAFLVYACCPGNTFILKMSELG
jgi:hypothetical protein